MVGMSPQQAKLQEIEERLRDIETRLLILEHTVEAGHSSDVQQLIEQYNKDAQEFREFKQKWDARDVFIERIKHILHVHIAKNVRDEIARVIGLIIRMGIIITAGILVGRMLRIFDMGEYASVVEKFLQ